MELIDFIKVYDDVLSQEECHKCIEIFETGRDEKKLNKLNNHNQKFTQYWISEKEYGEFIDLLKFKIGIYHSKYKSYISERLDYQFIFPYKYNFEGFKIKEYVPELKEEFGRHTDTSTRRSCRRFLSSLIYLNDVEEGGETTFNDVIIKPKEGRLLIFPPLWMFPHAGKIPISNIKYILTTYLKLRI